MTDEPPVFDHMYCGQILNDTQCPHEVDHPTKPVRCYCTKFGRTLRMGCNLHSLRCAPCREAHP